MPHTYVLGLGNVLMGDDGFGPAVARAFAEQYETGPEVEVVDVGTPGLDLTPWLTDVPHVVIVDTVRADLPPGSLRVYDKADLLRHPPFSRVGPHDPGVKETLLTLEFAGRAPGQVSVVGVVPADVGMGLTLSPQVSDALPRALEAVAGVLERTGCGVRRRPGRAAPALCWQPPQVASASRR
jgi:hydrogenase maturation protease